MKANTVTVRCTIRPSYGEPHHVKRKIIESLEWLTDHHTAITLEWLDDGDGEWPDDDDDDAPSPHP